MIELFIFIFFILIFFILIFNNINHLNTRQKMSYEILKHQTTIKILQKQIDLLEKISKDNFEQDSFFKFISDSREVAFEYIEELQNKLIEMDSNIKLKIAELSIEQKENVYEDLTTFIFLELDKLKEFLPKEDIDGR